MKPRLCVASLTTHVAALSRSPCWSTTGLWVWSFRGEPEEGRIRNNPRTYPSSVSAKCCSTPYPLRRMSCARSACERVSCQPMCLAKLERSERPRILGAFPTTSQAKSTVKNALQPIEMRGKLHGKPFKRVWEGLGYLTHHRDERQVTREPFGRDWEGSLISHAHFVFMMAVAVTPMSRRRDCWLQT